jgi:hypothetical protein
VGALILGGIVMLAILLHHTARITAPNNLRSDVMAPAQEERTEQRAPQRPVPPPIVPAATPVKPVASAPVAAPGPHLTPAEEHEQIVADEAAAQSRIAFSLQTSRRAAEEDCWHPAEVARDAHLDLTYGFTFDADGNETSRAIQEEGDGVPPPIRDCLRNYAIAPVHLPEKSLAKNVNVKLHYP